MTTLSVQDKQVIGKLFDELGSRVLEWFPDASVVGSLNAEDDSARLTISIGGNPQLPKEGC